MNGENFDPTHFPVAEYAALAERSWSDGVRIVRLVLRVDQPERAEFCRTFKDRGITVLGVLDRDSIGADPNDWWERMDDIHELYRQVVSILQPLNEPDGADDSSFAMPLNVVNGGLHTARSLWSDSLIAAPGLTNTKPWYAEGLQWDLCDYTSAHLYGRHVAPPPPGANTYGHPEEIIERYHALSGLPVLVSEWGYTVADLGLNETIRQTRLMADYLAEHADVAHAIHFCVDDLMVPGFGAYDEGKLLPQGAALYDSFWRHAAEPVTRPANGGAVPAPAYTIDSQTRAEIARLGWTPASDYVVEGGGGKVFCLEGIVYYLNGPAEFRHLNFL